MKAHRLTRAADLLTLAIVATAALQLPTVLSSFHLGLAMEILIFGLAAMSLDLLAGTGLVSLGHAAFFGGAAYTIGILMNTYHLDFPLTAGAAVLAATALGAFFGLLAVRTSGVYFLMVTLALAQVVWGLAYRQSSITGGDNGLSGISRPMLGSISLATQTHYYYFVLGVVAISALVLHRIVHSPFGLTLKGIRDSESRMKALGYNTWLHKYLVYVLAAAFAGVAGALYAYYNSFINPDTVTLAQSATFVLMVILGGVGTLWGALIGAGIIDLLRNQLGLYTDRWPTVMGAVFVLVVLFARDGLLGSTPRAVAWIGRTARRRATAATPGPAGH
jgi:branched-chain amino acid transport system permease protein